jgi:hypothetical protein
LLELHRAINRIEKDKHNQQGGYKYASEAAIKETFHPLFTELGLVLIPLRQEFIHFQLPTGDKKSFITTLKCTFALRDLESGEELVMEQMASGGDTLDKGTFKAVTGAIKYVLTTLFLIPTGDDPEKDSKSTRQEPQAKAQSKQDPESIITEPQQKRIFAVARAANCPTDRVKEIIGKAGYESSKAIKARDYENIIAEIQGTANA